MSWADKLSKQKAMQGKGHSNLHGPKGEYTHYNPKLPVTGMVPASKGGTGVTFNYHQAPPDPYIVCAGDKECFIEVNRGYLCRKHRAKLSTLRFTGESSSMDV